MAGTALDAFGGEVNSTQYHGFPMPPPLPGTVEQTFDGYGRYRLDNGSGGFTSYTRATTVAKTLDDTYFLEAWKQREILKGLVLHPALMTELGMLPVGKGAEESLTPQLSALSERALTASGSRRAAELGTAVHAWAAAVDGGQVNVGEVPAQFRDHITNYLRVCGEWGLVPEAQFTERTVRLLGDKVAGTMDRIFLCADGQRRIGDVKTSKTLEYSHLSFSIQLAIYHQADEVLTECGWSPMPETATDAALIAHVPSSAPQAATVVPVDLNRGRQAYRKALEVRHIRNEIKHAMRVTIETENRYAEARYRVLTATAETELAQLWETYRDIWTDDLTTMGRLALRTHTASHHI